MAFTKTPDLDVYRDDYCAGIPLLRSASAEIDLEPANGMIAALVERLRAAEGLRGAVRDCPIVAWLLGEVALEPSAPGLLRFLGWTALARYLRPIVDAYAVATRIAGCGRYCPSCGSAPAMAHLLGAEAERQRFLSCGRCATRWRDRRTQCPFCEADPQRLPVVAIEGEAGLRIDCCESCRAYLKRWAGRRGAPALGLDVAPSRRPRAGARSDLRGGISVRHAAARCRLY